MLTCFFLSELLCKIGKFKKSLNNDKAKNSLFKIQKKSNLFWTYVGKAYVLLIDLNNEWRRLIFK